MIYIKIDLNKYKEAKGINQLINRGKTLGFMFIMLGVLSFIWKQIFNIEPLYNF